MAAMSMMMLLNDLPGDFAGAVLVSVKPAITSSSVRLFLQCTNLFQIFLGSRVERNGKSLCGILNRELLCR